MLPQVDFRLRERFPEDSERVASLDGVLSFLSRRPGLSERRTPRSGVNLFELSRMIAFADLKGRDMDEFSRDFEGRL